MRLRFSLTLLLLSATFSGFAIAAQPDIHSNNVPRQSRQSVNQPSGDIQDRQAVVSAQTNKKIIFTNMNGGLGFGSGVAAVESASNPGLTSDRSIEAPFIDKHYLSFETGITDSDDGESEPAPLPNFLWLIGFGIFWILGARRNLDSSNAA